MNCMIIWRKLLEDNSLARVVQPSHLLSKKNIMKTEENRPRRCSNFSNRMTWGEEAVQVKDRKSISSMKIFLFQIISIDWGLSSGMSRNTLKQVQSIDPDPELRPLEVLRECQPAGGPAGAVETVHRQWLCATEVTQGKGSRDQVWPRT